MIYQFFGIKNDQINKIYATKSQHDAYKSYKKGNMIFGLIADQGSKVNISPIEVRWGCNLYGKAFAFARIETVEEKQTFDQFAYNIAIPIESYHHALDQEIIHFQPKVPHFLCGITDLKHVLLLTKESKKYKHLYERQPVLYPAKFANEYCHANIHQSDLMNYEPKMSFEIKNILSKSNSYAL